MKKLFNRAMVASCGLLASASAFAEGAAVDSGVDANLLTGYITEGKTEIIALFTAGAAIVGAFFIWGLIKKALKSSK